MMRAIKRPMPLLQDGNAAKRPPTLLQNNAVKRPPTLLHDGSAMKHPPALLHDGIAFTRRPQGESRSFQSCTHMLKHGFSCTYLYMCTGMRICI